MLFSSETSAMLSNSVARTVDLKARMLPSNYLMASD
jgi:hypothetical protein